MLVRGERSDGLFCSMWLCLAGGGGYALSMSESLDGSDCR